MTHSLPLLAAGGWEQLISVLAAIAFFVVWLVNQINDARKKQIAAGARPRVEPRAQPAGQAAVQGKAPPRDPLRAQVDEFLRRAGKQPAPAQGGPAPPPRAKQAGGDEIVLLLDESQAEPPRQRLAKKRPAMEAGGSRPKSAAPTPPRGQQPPQPARLVPAPRRQSLAEHVAEFADTTSQEFNAEVANLGERVKLADEQFDRQLHHRFDHELGSLASRHIVSAPDQQANVASGPAAEIAAMLSNPDGMRQAIVLQEILRRPVDRW